MTRLLLGSTPFLVLLTSWACNTNFFVDRAYPPAAQTDASVIRMISFEQDSQSRAAAHSWGASGTATLQLRLQEMGCDQGQVAGLGSGRRRPLAARRIPADLDAGERRPAKLDWEQGQNVFDKPDDPNTLNYVMLAFLIPRADYERLKSTPVTLHLDFALTQATAARSWRFPLPKGNFMIPDLASCSAIDNKELEVLHIFAVFCRFPLRTPTTTTVTALQTRGPCELAPAQPGDPALPTSNTFGNLGTAPAYFGISPMEQGELLNGPNFGSSSSDPKTVPIRLCPARPSSSRNTARCVPCKPQ